MHAVSGISVLSTLGKCSTFSGIFKCFFKLFRKKDGYLQYFSTYGMIARPQISYPGRAR